MLARTPCLPPGGAETQVLSIARALVRHKASAAIIAYGEPDDLPSSIDGVTIVARPAYRKKRIIGKFLEAFYVWRALWQAPSRAVVLRGASIELGLAGIYARLARRQLVFSTASVGDFDIAKLMSKRRDMLIYRAGVRLANAIVVQTEEQVAMCRASFGRDARLIKSIAMVGQAQSGHPEAFLWVGRLVSYKRPLEYVALARSLPEARFWMVGVPSPGPASADVELIEKVRVAAAELKNLELLAPRPHDEIEELMARAVASVNTADFEGMPNVLLEAWSRGVPALALHHDPDRVIQTHGLGGFAGGSRETLINLAREQWEERDERDAVADRCRNYITIHHSADHVVGLWSEAIFGARQGTEAPAAEAPGEITCAAS